MSNDTLQKTWEFKGVEILPLAIAQKNHALTIVGGMSAGPTMFAAVLYASICKKSDLMKGLRRQDWFLEQVSAWMEKIELGPDDYEELAKIWTELIEHTTANRAVPVKDFDMMEDPMGNE